MLQYIYLIVIVVMSCIVHIRWFSPGIFSYGDWWYTAPELISEFKFIANGGIWKSITGFGAIDPQMYFFPLNFIRGILSFLPHTDYWGLFFIYFLPIIIVPPIAFFFLIKRVIPDNLSAFIGSAAYTFATCFLTMQTAPLTIGLAYAITPLFLLAFVNFLQDKNKKLSSLIIAVLITTIAIIVEPRIFYILIIILLPSIFFIHKFFTRYLLFGMLVILLNFFWVLPLLTAGTEEVYAITDRPLFGNEFRSLKHALTGMQPAWSWDGPEPFEIQPIYATFWFIPIFVFTGMFFLPKQKRSIQAVTLFMYIIALLGIFLAKQSHLPLPEIYGWLYEHFPGFNLYRESSKFYILIAIAYAYLIAFTFYAGSKYYKEKKITAYKSIRAAVAVVVLGVLVIGTLPLMTGSFGSMFVHREISKDYELYKNFILTQNEYFRTMGVPKFPRWGAYTTKHPKIDAMNVLDGEWVQYKGEQEKVRDKISTLFKSPYINHLLDVSSIKYVFIPIRDVINEDDFFTFIDNEDGTSAREEYVELLDQVKDLKKIDIGTEELLVYQNDYHKPYIRALDKLYNLQSTENIDQKYNFITSELGGEFDFVLNEDVRNVPTVNVQGIFELMKSGDVENGAVRDTLSGYDKNKLYIHTDEGIGNVKINDKVIIEEKDFKDGNKFISLPLEQTENDSYDFLYEDVDYDFSNQIKNASFEKGLWADDVSDCNNYDDNGHISMNLINTDTKDSVVELHAKRHIACTGQDDINVDSGNTYLLNFDYQSDNAQNVGYGVNFDDDWDNAVKETIAIEDDSWHTFTKKINVPSDVTKASLYIYGYSENNIDDIIVRYDNFFLVKLPKIHDKYYLLSESREQMQKPGEIYFETINPTKKIIHVKNAKDGFYIVMSEAYHDKWILMFNNSSVNGFLDSWWPFIRPNAIENDAHFRYMTFLNGWYIDIEKYCQKDGLCIQNDDGTYNMEFVVEFFPQRWFYLGLLISSVLFMGLLGLLLVSFFLRRTRVKKIKN